MIVRAYLVDYTTKERLRSYRRKGLEFTAEILGKNFCKRYGERKLEMVTLGKSVRTSAPVYIDKETNLRFHFDSD